MKKEIIIVIIIIILIVIGHILTQNYTKKVFYELAKELNEIKISIKDNNMSNVDLKNKIDDVQKKWDEKYDMLAYYLEHDELEKVQTQLIGIKANVETEWYNYTNQVWANAVILEDESISYNNYDVIPESNIESYFVWIPRYKYKIWDEGKYESLTTIDESKVHTIQVEFETKDVTASKGSTENSWLTHPAFISFDVNLVD